MRVAYVTMTFPAPSEAFACSDVAALAALGVDVHVFALRIAHPRHVELVREHGLEDVPISTLTATRIGIGITRALSHLPTTLRTIGWLVRTSWRRPEHLFKCLVALPSAFAIVDDVWRERFDVVHMFWGHLPALVGHILLLRATRPVVTTFLGAYDLELDHAPGNDVARRADRVFTHAACNRPTLEERGVSASHITVVHRGLPDRYLAPQGPSSDEERDAMALLSVSRLIPKKRVDDVLKVFARVAEKHPRATLKVIGDGPEKAVLEQLARDVGVAERVAFLGHQPRDTVVREMSRASALLLLTAWEGERLPNVVKESMAYGCIPIVTRSPGIEELVTDHAHGFIVEQRDVDQAAARVDHVLSSNHLEGMRRACREHVRARFAASASMQVYRDTWLSCRERHEQYRGASL